MKTLKVAVLSGGFDDPSRNLKPIASFGNIEYYDLCYDCYLAYPPGHTSDDFPARGYPYGWQPLGHTRMDDFKAALAEFDAIFSIQMYWEHTRVACQHHPAVIVKEWDVVWHNNFQKRYGNFPNIPIVLDKAAMFVCQSQRAREMLLRKGVEARRTRMIMGFWDGPLGLNTDVYKPMEKPANMPFDKPLKNFVLMHVGTLNRFKGIDLLLPAIAELKRRGREVTMILAGKDKHEIDWSIMKETGIEENVVFAGFIPAQDLPRYFAAADAMISFSVPQRDWIDPSPKVVKEGAACGLPIIGVALTGAEETVLDGLSGFKIPPCDIGALVESVEWLMDHPKQAAIMGKVSRLKALREWSIPVIQKQMEEVVNYVVEKAKSK